MEDHKVDVYNICTGEQVQCLEFPGRGFASAAAINNTSSEFFLGLMAGRGDNISAVRAYCLSEE